MEHLIKGKNILVGVSGGIAAYKACDLVSTLTRMGGSVRVMMTANAARFVGPVSFQALSGSPVVTDTFGGPDPGGIDHIRLAEFADILVVLPATANVLAKMAHGIADDILSTTFLACGCPVLAVPAMESRMYANPATRANLETLSGRGIHILPPERGRLASGKQGEGRLPGREKIIEAVAAILGAGKRLAGKKVLITAGPTREALDPVRFISNPSSGRMGFALARAAARMGASEVHLVSGPSELATPLGVVRHDVTTAREMLDAVSPLAAEADLFIAAAAVSDFAPAEYSERKIKKESLGEKQKLELTRTPDILAHVSAARKKGATVVGFAVETDNEYEAAMKKVRGKKLDYIVVNNPGEPEAGFYSEKNRVTVLDSGGNRVEVPLMPKEELAGRIIELVTGRLEEVAGGGEPG